MASIRAGFSGYIRFQSVTALYRLDQGGASASAGKAELGPLPRTAVTLLSVLAAVWVLIGVYALANALRAKKKQR